MLIRKNKLTILGLLLVVILSLNACVKEDEQEKPEQEQKPAFVNLLPIPDGPDETIVHLDTGLSKKSREYHELNSDTIGWLHLPNTSIDNVVLFYPDENNKYFYLRRDFYKNDSFDGSYFVDYRSNMDGGREGLSKNTVIYGHSMSDDPTTPLFSQLKKYWNTEYAKENPYIYFSDLDEDMAFEIFAVFITHTDFNYNEPDPTEKNFLDLINACKGKSMYQYDTEVGADDKILTLSTCLYSVNGVAQGYPNNYRYVVMAKLLPSNEKLSDNTVFEVNPEAVVCK